MECSRVSFLLEKFPKKSNNLPIIYSVEHSKQGAAVKRKNTHESKGWLKPPMSGIANLPKVAFRSYTTVTLPDLVKNIFRE